MLFCLRKPTGVGTGRRICGFLSLLLFLTVILSLSACEGGKETPTLPDTEDVTEPVSLPPEEGGTAEVTAPPTESETEASSEDPTETESENEPVTEDYFAEHHIETVSPDTARVPDMAVTGKGYDIYQLPENADWGYRYGCTYLYNDDGSVDAYFACVGANTGEWDWISYRRSEDDGKSWSPERIVLTPTQGSMDAFSNCDPGVVYFNGYYYLGYTSTLNSKGACNNVFVARSVNPDGPFEKWNGTGWGGPNPQPILYYDHDFTIFGIGEPSFIELNGTLYLYYTEATPAGEYTMVATADAHEENWPSHLTFHGAAVKKTTDSLDVKYVEEWGKFVAVATGSRMGPNSYLSVYESNDGIHFTEQDAVREGTMTHLHNAGLSSRRDGHIRLSEDAGRLRVIYAHGSGWGTWNTRVQPISLKLSDGNDLKAEKAKPCSDEPFVRGKYLPEDQRTTTMVRPIRDVFVLDGIGKGTKLAVKAFDTYFHVTSLLRSEEIVLSGYDESVISVQNGGHSIKAVGFGETDVILTARGCSTRFHVIVPEQPLGSSTDFLSIEPVHDTYTIHISERMLFKPQLRVRLLFGDRHFKEVLVEDTGEKVTFTDYNKDLISVSATGVVTAKNLGETSVTVTCRGKSVKIRVIVTDDDALSHFHMDVGHALDYTNMVFTDPDTVKAVEGLHNASVTWTPEGMLVSVDPGLTDPHMNDPFFTIVYDLSEKLLKAEDYKTIEITYMVPTDVSAFARTMQLFFCTDTATSPDASRQTSVSLIVDGEFHTVSIDLSAFSHWKGDIHRIRFDFFDAGDSGDSMYVKSIHLKP